MYSNALDQVLVNGKNPRNKSYYGHVTGIFVILVFRLFRRVVHKGNPKGHAYAIYSARQAAILALLNFSCC